MFNTDQKIQAPTTNSNPYGLMATPAVDLTPTGHLPYLVGQPDTAREHPETAATPDTSPLAGLSTVLALVDGTLVPTVCPTRFCKENHTGENTGHLEDVNHTGATVDLYAPNFQGRADDLFAYAHLTQDPYSKNPKERAACIRVEDGGGEESPLTPDQADTFADNLTVFAGRIRALARTARTTGEPATESGPVATPAAGIIAQIQANADAANKAGLGGPAMDAFNAEVIRLLSASSNPDAAIGELAQLLHLQPTHTTECRLFPAWCIEAGPHYDHVSADVKVIDTEGKDVIDARVLYLSDSNPTVCIGQSDFTADQARMKAAELRGFADRIDELSGHVDKAHAPKA